MKSIIKSLIVVIAVAAVAGGATYSYFTSQAKITGMTFATGTLDVSNASESWMTHVSFQGLKPGDTVRKWVVLENTGNLDIASLKVSAVNKNDSADLLKNITVSVYGTVDGHEQGIYTPNWGTGQPVSDWLTDINILDTPVYENHNGVDAATTLEPNKKDTIILDFKVPTSLGNEFQGKTASFDLQFDAEQSHTAASYF